MTLSLRAGRYCLPLSTAVMLFGVGSFLAQELMQPVLLSLVAAKEEVVLLVGRMAKCDFTASVLPMLHSLAA